MRQLFQAIAALSFCFVFLFARGAKASPGNFDTRTVDTVAGTLTTHVHDGTSIDDLAREYQAAYDPTGSTKLTWQDIYAANRDLKVPTVIPVCNSYVIDTFMGPRPGFKYANHRGARGEAEVWDEGCAPKFRHAWLVAGSLIVIPVKPLETVANKAAIYDDTNKLMQRLVEKLGPQKGAEAIATATADVVAAENAKADAALKAEDALKTRVADLAKREAAVTQRETAIAAKGADKSPFSFVPERYRPDLGVVLLALAALVVTLVGYRARFIKQTRRLTAFQDNAKSVLIALDERAEAMAKRDAALTVREAEAKAQLALAAQQIVQAAETSLEAHNLKEQLKLESHTQTKVEKRPDAVDLRTMLQRCIDQDECRVEVIAEIRKYQPDVSVDMSLEDAIIALSLITASAVKAAEVAKGYEQNLKNIIDELEADLKEANSRLEGAKELHESATVEMANDHRRIAELTQELAAEQAVPFMERVMRWADDPSQGHRLYFTTPEQVMAFEALASTTVDVDPETAFGDKPWFRDMRGDIARKFDNRTLADLPAILKEIDFHSGTHAAQPRQLTLVSQGSNGTLLGAVASG